MSIKGIHGSVHDFNAGAHLYLLRCGSPPLGEVYVLDSIIDRGCHDIRKIEMRYYPVPEAAPTDAVLEERAQRHVVTVAGGRALVK